MKELRARLGARVRQLRLARRLTQEGLAERAGLSYKFLGEVERGVANPTLDTLQQISRALNIEIAELFVPAVQVSGGSPSYAITARELQVVREALESLGSLVEGVEASYRRGGSRRRRPR